MACRLPSWQLALIACGWIAIGAGASLGQQQAVTAAQKGRDLLTAAGEDHFWIARVTTNADHTAQTTILFRSQWTGNADWNALPLVPQRVVSVSASSGDLLMVLSNGQWEIASGEAGNDTPIRTGPTGSQVDEMLAIASGGGQTWAVVRWLPATTQPSATQISATTQPATQASALGVTTQEIAGKSPGGGIGVTTMPTTEPVIASATGGGPRLMVSLFGGGSWTQAQPVPEGVEDDASRLSMEVVDGMPVLAWETAEGKVFVSRLTAERGWTAPMDVNEPGSLADFKLLTIKGKWVLWLDERSGAATTRATTGPAGHGLEEMLGEVLVGDDLSKRIVLEAATTLPPNIGPRTLVSAFGNLRWIAYAGDQMVEQDFSEDVFPESLPAARMSVAPIAKPTMIQLEPWIGGYSMLVVLAGLAGMRQKSLADQEPEVQDPEGKLRLAPLGIRFVAGLVDLSPILAVAAIVHPANAGNPVGNIEPKSLEQLVLLAQATYVLHTLVAELICGQSIGKMVFGLRVVNTDGETAKPAAILLRNILRVVDVVLVLPMLIVLITPLRQRVGDIVGGTVVIAKDGGEEEDDGDRR